MISLTSQDPQHVENICQFDHSRRAFQRTVLRLQSYEKSKYSLSLVNNCREMTICLLDIPSHIIHRDSPEAKQQTEREAAALEQQRRRQVVTTEETEEAKTEEIDLRKKVILSLHFLLLIGFYYSEKNPKGGKKKSKKNPKITQMKRRNGR